MKISRRHFLFLTAGFVAGCKALEAGDPVGGRQAETFINAGPVTQYAAEGVYAGFRDRGFFLIRRKGRLFALSAYCTHRRCKIEAEPDRSFYCPCHGSAFDPDGRVIGGPARRALPALPVFTDQTGNLFVRNMGG